MVWGKGEGGQVGGVWPSCGSPYYRLAVLKSLEVPLLSLAHQYLPHPFSCPFYTPELEETYSNPL